MPRVAITGCASGIGAGSARVLRSRGAHVTGFTCDALGLTVEGPP